LHGSNIKITIFKNDAKRKNEKMRREMGKTMKVPHKIAL
jgi:hypothetical protein